ncbi:MAG: WD40 repeat domain-containing serine/threonine protein kinase [Myxococcota bacterium]
MSAPDRKPPLDLPATQELPPNLKPGVDDEVTTSGGAPVVVGAEAPGRYARRDEELGVGGIGRVLVAFDNHLGREIAVKELLGEGSAVGRFLREARVTAQLEHPNIVPVYELGRRADGTLYYTMKRVRGRTLAEALDDCADITARLRLLSHFVDTCQAIAYAHSRGVVHRDIKPANIMVGEFGETVVLDWGLAKARGQRDLRGGDLAREIQLLRETAHAHTLQGTMMGTPSYMSPEQARGEIDHIDERSDVWSLGAVLFEILTGVAPFNGRTPLEILAKVVHEPPPNADEAPIELAKVAAKALRRDPAERYQSAKELADEIAAWQTGHTVRAHSYSSWEILRKFVARNRAAVTIATSLVTALCLVYGATLAHVSAQRARADEARLAATGDLARSFAGRAHDALRAGDASAAWVLAAGALALADTPEARGAMIAASSGFLPTLAWTADVGEPCGQLAWAPDGHAIAAIGRRGAWVRSGEHMSLLDMQGEAAASVGWAGARLYTAHAAGTVLAWDPPVGVVERIGPADDGVRAFAVAPDGRVVTGGFEGKVRAWTGGKRPRLVATHPGRVDALAVAGDRIAATGEGGTRLWDDGRERIADAPARALALSPDGRLLAAGRSVWDVDTGARVAVLGGEEPRALAFSPDGARLAAAVGEGVDLWDVASSRVLGHVATHGGASTAVTFSPDGRRFATATLRGALRAWDVPSPAPFAEGNAPPGDPGALGAREDPPAVFAAFGELVATGGDDGGVTLWDRATGAARATWPAHAGRVAWLAFTADGGGLRSEGPDGPRAWRLDTLAAAAAALADDAEARFGLRLRDAEVAATR